MIDQFIHRDAMKRAATFVALLITCSAAVAWHHAEIVSPSGLNSKFAGDWMVSDACVMRIQMPNGSTQTLMFRPVAHRSCLVSADDVERALSERTNEPIRIVFAPPPASI